MLSPVEQSLFGATAIIPLNSQEATDEQKEILVRADRVLTLGKATGSWSMTRTNDPRFHVGWNQLKKELQTVDHDAHGMSAERGMQQLHIRKIRSLLLTKAIIRK